MSDLVKCSQGHENSPGDKFCRTCGEKITGGEALCPHCEATNDSKANFCVKCGGSMSEKSAPEIEGKQWRRGHDDFATRVDVDDLEGIFKKGLIVGEGTTALLFVNGKLSGTLEPGKYDLQGVKDRLKEAIGMSGTAASAILIDSGDVEINLNISDVYTKDPLNIDVTCKVIAKIHDSQSFFTNIMKDRKSYLVSELRGSLYDELHNAMNEAIGKKPAEELNSNLALKKQFEAEIERHLSTTFQRSGLNFIQLRTVDYKFKGFDKVKGIHEEVFLLVSEDEAKLQGRKKLFDVFDRTKVQEIAEEIRKTDHYRQMSTAEIDQTRAEVEKDIGIKGVAADKEVGEWKLAAETRNRIKEHLLDKTKTEDEIEQFLLEIEKGKMLRDQEIKDLRTTLAEKDQDHDIKRQFMLKKLDLEQELDYERSRLTGKAGLEIELVELEEKKKRMQFESDMSRMKTEQSAVREEKIKNKMAEIQLEQDEDKADLETARLAQEMMLENKRKKQELELNDERQKQILELEAEEKRLEMQIKHDKVTHDQDIEKTRTDQDHELKKIAALSNASAEAVMSMAGPEQAKLIKELKETEAMKGMSEDQILAKAAANSPEVAKAFQEKYKGLPMEEANKLYQMLIDAKDKALEDKDKTSAEKDKFMADAMERIERMASKALDAQKDATTGVAQGIGRANNPSVVYPPPGQPGFVSGNVGGEVVVCSKCKARVAVTPGLKFCNNCGHDLF